MRASTVGVAALAAIGGLGAGSQARADHINACANSRQGYSIHLVHDTAQCKPWEIPLSWSDDEPPDLTPLEDAIAQNTADIASLADQVSTIVSAIQVKAAGGPIGTFIGATLREPLEQADAFLTLSATDYVFAVDFATGKLRDPSVGGMALLFAQPGCTGQAYARQLPPLVTRNGGAFPSPYPLDPISVYYVPPGSIQQSVFVGSQMYPTGCDAPPGGPQLVVMAFPNDTAITGVPDDQFATPITLGH